MSRSVHDNNIYAYQMASDPHDHCQYRLRLYTEFLNGEAAEYTDILFAGVWAHHFQNVRPGNIILAVESCSMEECYYEYQVVFDTLLSEGWPVPYTTPRELFDRIAKASETIFCIMSSYGLHGWIWAESMMIQERQQRAAL